MYGKMILLTILIVTILVLGCGGDKDKSYLINRFVTNKPKLNNLAKCCRQKQGLDSFINKEKEFAAVNMGEFDSTLNKTFKEIGIIEILSYRHDGCKALKQYDFKTNWNQNHPIHLSFDSCDSIETADGFYRQDENRNEFWGLGDNWKMWKEIKLLSPKL
jgi:hypothetical protein